MAAHESRDAPATVAVLDVGKTNVKLNAATDAGRVVEAFSVPNAVRPGPPWRHHDLAGLGDWAFESLATLCRRHPITTVVAAGHGSGGMLTGDDPDAGDGLVLPMIDYEQAPPEAVDAAYGPLAGSFFDRGSAIMMAATHQARQMLWMEMAEPEAFARARWSLGIPQYWAWRLTGEAVSEATCLGAQSHLWNVPERRFAPIVRARGWERLLPPVAPAWAEVGRIRPALAARHGLPKGLRVLAGIHDSSANFYRYQSAGLSGFTVLSTGTWIVGLSGETPLERLAETPGMTLNSDVHGRPVGGALTMGGREFSHVAGPDPSPRPAEAATIARLVDQGTMALPSFHTDDGLFPGSAGRGRIAGPPPLDAEERRALAVLYTALLADECLTALASRGQVVLDGSSLRDPAFAALLAGLRPDQEVVYTLETDGVAAGAALLATHESRTEPAPLSLAAPQSLALPRTALAAYAARWRAAARASAAAPAPEPM
ncbi:FGGY-family carbohydrate kinase [Chthonobacter rhizosphaerae]|uniref:FGGY-family carbohydrate kinase n=1 Tax=Chthonobacter rhizosphaerae TaxID=2735553 RepID=UPI0015EFB8E0|nr:FGGY family carbohydrate kinase [Chthonobacter rhizosphaerae]